VIVMVAVETSGSVGCSTVQTGFVAFVSGVERLFRLEGLGNDWSGPDGESHLHGRYRQ
jgi:hypothetical protein